MKFSAKYYLFGVIILSVLILTGCSSEPIDQENTTILSLGQYTMQAGERFVSQPIDQLIDPRIAGNIQQVYIANTHTGYKENIIISRDVLPPNTALEDYAQASFEAIGATWRNTQLLRTSTSTFTCQALTHRLYTQSFELDRLREDKTHTQTLYFVQGYVLQDNSITIISFNTSNQKNVSMLENYVDSIACARP